MRPTRLDPAAHPAARRFLQRVAGKAACALLLPACLATAVALQVVGAPASDGSDAASQAVEWPREWDGAPLRPLALSAVERRFARQFPGALARLTDGERVLVLRQVTQPTRMLHPAADCYQGLGFRIAAERLEQDAQGDVWRCFDAVQGGRAQRVCERIQDAAGRGFTDTSAWYWAAVSGQSRGPWQAVTVATPLSAQPLASAGRGAAL